MPAAAPDPDSYIAGLPEAVRPVLREVRAAIRAALPEGEERVRYGMPAVMLDDRYALHDAGWKRHVGLYPVSSLPAELEAEVAAHRTQKDSVTFRYADGVPYDLIRRIAAQLGAQRRG